jgi:DNA-binding NarL/FixJ family response regulator
MVAAFRLVASGAPYIPVQALDASQRTSISITKLVDVPVQARMRGGVTHRQSDVISLLLQGRSNRQIGKVLQISENTVKHHVRNVLLALGVSSRTEALVVLHKNAQSTQTAATRQPWRIATRD